MLDIEYIINQLWNVEDSEILLPEESFTDFLYGKTPRLRRTFFFFYHKCF